MSLCYHPSDLDICPFPLPPGGYPVSDRTLLSGNEAVARGAWQAGAVVGAGYPGTPSTEVLEAFALLPGVEAEWAPNEKVALEVAAGVSLGGARSIVTMKHVGLNVAADVLFTLAYTGVTGGLVLLVADDPGMHSSQNEQDTRNYAAFAKVPLLEPADSQEALDFTRLAFEMSELFDTPVIVRSTIRIAHSKGLVEVGERVERETAVYEKRPAKYVMMPGNAKQRRLEVASRLDALASYSDELDLNRIERRDPSLGVITSGVTYEYVREALPDASVLKLAMLNPLPARRILEFAAGVERLVAVEELDPYIETAVRAMGIAIEHADLPFTGELTPRMIAEAFGADPLPLREAFADLPPRPPMLCPGCPHRGVFHALGKLGAVVTGDIGCYTLGALPPLSAMDSCVCMGASIGMAHGFELAASPDAPVVAVIGDSTFAHSGLTGLLNAVYNGSNATTVILDNRVTAMTGHQDNPFTARTLMGRPAPELDIEAVCRGLGVEDVSVVDPMNLRRTERALQEAFEHEGPSVVIARRPCALLVKSDKPPLAVKAGVCTACGVCLALGCPALSRDASAKAVIDASLCVGCAQCAAVCEYRAIVVGAPACEAGETL
jgi:indolepyruvate ferredoxin oxidoreductase, alpha subunit